MPSFVHNLLRARDFLDAQLEFVNLRLDDTDPGRPRLRRSGAGAAAIVLRLPPQHVAEEVASDGPLLRFPYRAVLSGPSRIAFAVPDDFDLPFTAEALCQQSDQQPGPADLSPVRRGRHRQRQDHRLRRHQQHS